MDVEAVKDTEFIKVINKYIKNVNKNKTDLNAMRYVTGIHKFKKKND